MKAIQITNRGKRVIIPGQSIKYAKVSGKKVKIYVYGKLFPIVFHFDSKVDAFLSCDNIHDSLCEK